MSRSSSRKEFKRIRFRRYIRPIVLRRDKFRCRVCGVKENLTVHHIEKFADTYHIKQKFRDISNMVTLCYKCHESAPNGNELYDVWEQRSNSGLFKIPPRKKYKKYISVSK